MSKTMITAMTAMRTLALTGACAKRTPPPADVTPPPTNRDRPECDRSQRALEAGRASGAAGRPGRQGRLGHRLFRHRRIFARPGDPDDAGRAGPLDAGQPQRPRLDRGPCDERGTREYNIALGERRANAARDYLLSQGVPASRLVTISWGKERPAATGSNEEAWAQNRRAVTVIIR